MQSTLSLLVAFAASALAIQVTSPAQGSSLDLSKDNKITWASVSSDPSSFQIQLVNQAVNPPVTTTIADNVQTSSGSFDLKSVKDVTPGQGYQINLVSTSSQNQGILAQSAQFTVAKAGDTTTSASFSSSTPSGSSAFSTSTSTSGSSSSGSTSATTTGDSASASGSSSPSSSGSDSSDSSAAASATPTESGSGSASGSGASSTGSASAGASGAASRLTGSAFAGVGFFGVLAALLA
ncbi:MAG: hypothetical protein Q9160_002083 [Pyrenula sp. 1 TL-2023]